MKLLAIPKILTSKIVLTKAPPNWRSFFLSPLHPPTTKTLNPNQNSDSHQKQKMQRPSPHSNFFSSLKQLEKRLKLDNPSQQQAIDTPTQSLITPLYLNLNCDETPADSSTSNTNLKESETPLQFLSDSPLFQGTPPQMNSTQVQERVGIVEDDVNGVDEIELLMQLLGLSARKRVEVDLGCDDAFYGKIVGVKGPKSEKEVERLEGWIEHFLNRKDGERMEPFRLAHLLLGKAALVHSEVFDGVGGFEFPSTINEFLHNDPPIDEVAFSLSSK